MYLNGGTHGGMERVQKFPCLVRRNGSYYMRVRVPKDLVPILKRTELKRSLNTKHFREARSQYQRVYGQLLRQITEARERLTLRATVAPSVADAALQETVRDWFFRVWEQSQRDFERPRSPGAPAPDEMVAQAEMELEALGEGDGSRRTSIRKASPLCRMLSVPT